MKKCSKCSGEFPLEDFHRDKYTGSGHRSQCKKCVFEFTHSPKQISYMAEYVKKYRKIKGMPWLKKEQAKRKLNARTKVLLHYSQGKLECACCGEKEITFLCIDHIKGGGVRHKKENKIGDLARWIVSRDFPPDYQILCHNCNWGKHKCGQCPHLSKNQSTDGRT